MQQTLAKYASIDNVEIFNLSSFSLSPQHKLVLGLGPKHIPAPRCSIKCMQDSLRKSTDKLYRQLDTGLHFAYEPLLIDTIPYNAYKPIWLVPEHPYTIPLRCSVDAMLKEALVKITKSHHSYSTCDRYIHTILTELRNNPDIVIKMADKNVGPVLMNKADYIAMCLVHLNDTDTYIPVKNYNPNQLYAKLRVILHSHHALYEDEKTGKLTKLAASLLQLQGRKELRIAPIYCLPKLHKGITTIPVPSRLIMPALHTATEATSQYLDKELQSVLRRLPTVCHSSRQAMYDISRAKIPLDHVFLCADISALYPSIPIDFGIGAVEHTCRRLNVFDDATLHFLLSLLRWVLGNNFCTFQNVIYHQVRGTAIGTPTAVNYSNIVVYDMEHPILYRAINPSFYSRFIDDIISALTHTHAQEFIEMFNAINPSIHFDPSSVTIRETDSVFLDVSYSLQYELDDFFCTVTHKLYQKPVNKYHYIPYLSNHQPHVFKNFITQELKRYRLSCTNDSDFKSLVVLFKQRLARRGYPPDLVDAILPTLPTRAQLFEAVVSSMAPARHPKACSKPPPVITLSLPKLHPDPHWRQIFKLPVDITGFAEYRAAYGNSNIVIGHKNPPNIASFIISSTLK